MIKIKYSKYIDLIFHIMAYIQVNNASNCYSQKYIDELKEEKKNLNYDIKLNLLKIEEYYNNNFERLSIINFLPFESNSFEDMKSKFVNYQRFTETDLKYFIYPLIEILDNESVFYFAYWDKIHNNLHYRKSLENILINEFEKYLKLFDNTSIDLYLSYSLTRNGRGYKGINNSYIVLAPFPKMIEYIFYLKFTLIHEYTHLLTDHFIKNINMDDGSHSISEKIVILTDYYLIEALNKNDLLNYFLWLEYLAKENGIKDVKLNEDIFFSIFDVNEEIRIKIKKFISSIVL